MQKIRKAGRERTISERAFVAVAEMFGLADADYPMPGSIWGVDLSHWTGIVSDWQKVKDSGCRFVIIKAMHGKNITNCFKENYAGARSVGLPVSLYQWLCPAAMVSPGGQARAYADLCKQYPPTMRDVWTDFEWTPYTYKENGHAVTVTTELDDLESFMSVWFAEYGKPIGIYSSPSYWQEHGSTNSKWLQYPLWIANYRATSPHIPAPFIRELFWQFSENGDGDTIGTAPGERRVDLNIFNDTEINFSEYLSGTEIPPVEPPIEPGETEMIYVGKVLSSQLNIRSTPDSSIQTNILGKLNGGDIVQATEIAASVWWKLHKITRVDVDIALPAAECYASQGATNGLIDQLTVVEVAAPPLPGVLPTVTISISGGDEYQPVAPVQLVPK